MVWSHNDNWMVTGDHTGYVKYWQSNMNNVRMFQAHKEPIRGIRYFWISMQRNTIRPTHIRFCYLWICQSSFSPSDNKFVSCSDDGTLRVFDFLRCQEERVLRGHGADVKCVHWHPHKALIVSGSKDNQQPIKLWDPKSGQALATLYASIHRYSVCYSLIIFLCSFSQTRTQIDGDGFEMERQWQLVGHCVTWSSAEIVRFAQSSRRSASIPRTQERGECRVVASSARGTILFGRLRWLDFVLERWQRQRGRRDRHSARQHRMDVSVASARPYPLLRLQRSHYKILDAKSSRRPNERQVQFEHVACRSAGIGRVRNRRAQHHDTGHGPWR